MKTEPGLEDYRDKSKEKESGIKKSKGIISTERKNL